MNSRICPSLPLLHWDYKHAQILAWMLGTESILLTELSLQPSNIIMYKQKKDKQYSENFLFYFLNKIYFIIFIFILFSKFLFPEKAHVLSILLKIIQLPTKFSKQPFKGIPPSNTQFDKKHRLHQVTKCGVIYLVSGALPETQKSTCPWQSPPRVGPLWAPPFFNQIRDRPGISLDPPHPPSSMFIF